MSDTPFDSEALSKAVTWHLRYDEDGALRVDMIDVEEVYRKAKREGKLPEGANLNWFIGWAYRHRKHDTDDYRFMIIRKKDSIQMCMTASTEVSHHIAVNRRQVRQRVNG
jgi:hypothetical protein